MGNKIDDSATATKRRALLDKEGLMPDGISMLPTRASYSSACKGAPCPKSTEGAPCPKFAISLRMIGSFFTRKKKSSPCGPYLLGMFQTVGRDTNLPTNQSFRVCKVKLATQKVATTVNIPSCSNGPSRSGGADRCAAPRPRCQKRLSALGRGTTHAKLVLTEQIPSEATPQDQPRKNGFTSYTARTSYPQQ